MASQTDTEPKLSAFAEAVLAYMIDNKVSGREMAKRLGLSANYIHTLRSGKTEIPSLRTLRAAAEVIGPQIYNTVPSGVILDGTIGPGSLIARDNIAERGSHILRRPDQNVLTTDTPPIEPSAFQDDLPRDVPVYGVTMGGQGHDFSFNGQVVDHVRRAPGIRRARNAYAAYIVGDSMVPAYREGSLVYVNPDRPPAIGDDVVIELHGEGNDEAGPGYIKRLKRRSGSQITVEQFNPPQDIKFDAEEVKHMHRVVPWNELLGI